MNGHRSPRVDDAFLPIEEVERPAGKGILLHCRIPAGSVPPAEGVLYPAGVTVRVVAAENRPHRGQETFRSVLRVRGVRWRTAQKQLLLLPAGAESYVSTHGYVDALDEEVLSVENGQKAVLCYGSHELGGFTLRKTVSCLFMAASRPLPFVPGALLCSKAGGRYRVRAPEHDGEPGSPPPLPNRPGALLSWLLSRYGYAGKLVLFDREHEAAHLVGSYLVSNALFSQLSSQLSRRAARPGGVSLEEARNALGLSGELLRAFVESSTGELRMRGSWIVPADAHGTRSPAARRLLSKIEHAGAGGIALAELGKPATEKLVRALERSGECHIMRNKRVIGAEAVRSVHALLWEQAAGGVLKLGDAARTLKLSRSQTGEIIAILERNELSRSVTAAAFTLMPPGPQPPR